MSVLFFVLGFALALVLIAPLAGLWARRSARQARILERRLRKAQQLAELASLTGGLAHEIRNPLATLRLSLDLLAEEWAEADPANLSELARRSLNKLATLRRETDRLDDILEDFLRYAGQHKLDFEIVDLTRVVQELVEFFAPQAAAGKIQLRVGPCPEPLPVRMDVNLFKQAVLNLLINAQQAMAAKAASQTVAAADAEAPSDPLSASGFVGELIIRTYLAGGQACLDIVDTGPGIEPDRLGRIFDAYYSTKRGGTGLGLPTTRRIVEEHSGRIEVHSVPGQGTSFTIRLPIASQPVAPAPHARQQQVTVGEQAP